MPRILIVVTKGEVGGAQQSVFLLAKGLKERGSEVFVVTGVGDYLKEKLQGVEISHTYFDSLVRGHNLLSSFRFAFELRRFVKRNAIDVVHFNSSNTFFAAPFLPFRIKSVFTFRGLSVLDGGYEASFFLKFLYKWYFKFFLSFVDRSVFVCQFNEEYIRGRGIVKNGVVIYNAVDEERLHFLQRSDAREEIAKIAAVNLDGKFLIGSIGRLAYPKNYEFLLNHLKEILEKIPEAFFVIFGEGPERTLYEKIIADKNLGSAVCLLGEKKNASQYLKAFDLFVLPSKYEGLSITLLEALHAQGSILVSDVGGAKEILPSECIYQTDDFSEFLDKLLRIKEQNFIPPFPPKISRTHLIDQYLKLYTDILSSKKSL